MLRWQVPLFLLLLLLPGMMLTQSGALHSDLSGDPDEAAHAVTALMIRDYLATAPGSNPMAFARSYYEAYPKVALGHYPPGYYGVGALFLLALPKVSALLWMQAVALTAIGLLVWRFCRGEPALKTVAAPAALVTVCLPPMLKTLVLVMADLQLTLWCLLAALAWARFLCAPRWGWSLAFGLAAALAVLTKGSGLMLGALPLVSTLLAGKAALLRQPVWWLGAAPVVVLAGPWMAMTAGITKEGMIETGMGAFVLEASSFYARALPHSIGRVLLLSTGLALLLALWRWGREGRIGKGEAVLWGWLCGGVLLLVLVPAGLTTRYLVPLLPPVTVLGLAAVGRLASGRRAGLVETTGAAMVGGFDLRGPASQRSATEEVAAGGFDSGGGRRGMTAPCFWLPWLLAVLVLAETLRLPRKELAGYRQVAAQLLELPRDRLGERRWLIASDARGEGAVIAACCYGVSAEERLRFDTKLLRGSKSLAESDWMGRGYQTLVEDAAGMSALLDALRVDVVVLDETQVADKRPAHLDLLAAAIQNAPDQWRLAAALAARRMEGIIPEGLKLYTRTGELPR